EGGRNLPDIQTALGTRARQRYIGLGTVIKKDAPAGAGFRQNRRCYDRLESDLPGTISTIDTQLGCRLGIPQQSSGAGETVVGRGPCRWQERVDQQPCQAII